MGKVAVRQHESGFFEQKMPDTKKRQAAKGHHKAAAAAAAAAELAQQQSQYNGHTKIVRSSGRRNWRVTSSGTSSTIAGPSFAANTGHRSQYVESDDDEDDENADQIDGSDDEDGFEQNTESDDNGEQKYNANELDSNSEADDEEVPPMEIICLDSDEDGEFNFLT